MPEKDLREIPKHDISVKASIKERSMMKDLGEGVMKEIIEPKAKEILRNMFRGITNMFGDALNSSIDKVLYKDGNAPTTKSSTGYYTGSTNYTSYSKPIGEYQPQRGRDTIGQRGGNEVKFIWVPSEEDAKQIIGALKEDIINYKKAKVASLYEMVHERTTFADFKYGWTDVNQLGYYEDFNRRPGENRWFLDLAKPVDITEI